MQPSRKRLLGYYFSLNAKSFHVVARLKDTPGAANSVFEILRSHLDFVANTIFSLEDGSAIFSGFGKSLSKAETEGELKRLLESLPVVAECEVKGSDQGLLIDSYHSGIDIGPNRPGILLPLVGISRIFDRLADIFGSGGGMILFEEGSAMGQSSGQYLNANLADTSLDWKIKALVGICRTYGWGVASLEVENPNTRFRVSFRDCFECAGTGKRRNGCDFFRGHLASAISTLSGNEFECEESKCTLRGDPVCEFVAYRHEASRAMSPVAAPPT